MNTHGGISNAVAEAETELRRLPEEIGSAEAKLVYHSLDAAGPGDAEELARRLNLKKMALFSVLNSLERNDLVERDGTQYCCS